MSYEVTKIQLVGDNVIRIDHPGLPETPNTFLTSASTATAVSLTVRDNSGFTNSSGGDLLLVGNYGEEQTEIKYVNGAVTSGTSLTTTAMTFPHSVGTPIRKILFDKVEIYGNTSASSSGSTLIATISLDVSAPYTEYVVTGTTYAYYGARYIRSIATTYNGTYSDFIQASGYDTNTIGFVIKKAFEAVGEEIKPSGVLSKSWAYDQIFLGEKDVEQELKKGWSWLQQFDADMGNVTLGVNTYALPTDLADRNTSKKIQGLRIGKRNALKYITKREYDSLFQNVANTTVATTYVGGAASIVLTDSRDFDDSGSINVYFGSTIESPSYTGNTRSTNTLTGVTGDPTGATQGDQVWQGEPRGLPTRYTIFEGNILFDTVPDTTANLVGENIWIDYYKIIVRVNSDGDYLTVPDSYCIQLWLEAMIKKHKQGGNLSPQDSSWIEYQRRKQRLIFNEVSGQGVHLVPSFYQDYGYPTTTNYPR